MIGDIVYDDGILYEVVWNGGEGLVGSRETRLSGPPSLRAYNKSGKYAKKVPTPEPPKDTNNGPDTI
jgi:hypothetical protein